MKHRSTAAELVEQGHVRLNRVRITKPSCNLKAGDVLTLALHGGVRVVRVLNEAERRGPATEARGLYEDLAPQASHIPDAENLGAYAK